MSLYRTTPESLAAEPHLLAKVGRLAAAGRGDEIMTYPEAVPIVGAKVTGWVMIGVYLKTNKISPLPPPEVDEPDTPIIVVE